jgi:hypothetical protein
MAYTTKYKPINPKKYKGDVNNIICRSLWERKFAKYADTNDNVLEWAVEEIIIPYFDPTTKKMRRYFPDFYIKYVDREGKIKKAIIEIKPLRETQEPKRTKGKSNKTLISETLTYVKNQAKWEAAREFCKDNLIEFRVMTEKELGI